MNLIYDGNNMRLYDAKGSIRAASNSFITANGYTYDGMRQPRNPAYDSWIWIFDTTPTFTTAPGPAGLKIRTLNCAYNASDRVTTFSATCAIGEFPRTSSYYRAEQYDPDLGLYYLRARYYNPLTGRFLSRDPENGITTDPATLHKYVYGGGDPVNALDPTGRQTAVLGAPAIDYGVIVIRILQTTAGVITTGLAVECAYNFLASETGAWTAIGLAGDGDSGIVYNAGPCRVKEEDFCTNRRDDEEARCWAKYPPATPGGGGNGKYGNNKRRGACLQRAEWRWNNCLRGLPDPAPPLAELRKAIPIPLALDGNSLLSFNSGESCVKEEIDHGGF
jgi:RHS repeat-associated protein